ncbi:electron transfer flavoprotein subunit alpha/FixB family protein [Aromatoleum diolicum]|uniref:Electron transfer flavoprotein subunit alpha/FixB family protein n=1 Tax=Aromatoleum diolicum TaxID=75796 RepID=A0ABX1QK34_9RHOO|nr:FAD-binding protein [Aromatoleum diolicum]NMG77606.1 electron transfer flavoprotein subunit alpha/FixB family protein [Aromatoleum diolicum]
MKVLVIAEHDNRRLAGATLNAVGAAQRFGGEVQLLVAGSECAGVAAEGAALQGVAQVICVEAEHYGAQSVENLSVLVAGLVRDEAFTVVLAGASGFGKNLAPRIAALLDVAPVSDVVSIDGAGSYVRPVYAGNVMVTVTSDEPIQVLTVRTTAFPAAAAGGAAARRQLAPGPDLGLSRLVGRELSKSERPELAAARIVVSGGRGLTSGEKYREVLEPLADRLGAALGASRAAVDAGFVPNDYQVGQTGKIVAPDLYVAVGISGAIQHLAGMKDSKVIVAINKDPDAPIFQVADFGLVGDLFDVVPDLVGALATE